MADTSLRQTNRTYLIDIIEFTSAPKRLDKVEIARKHRETNWSTQQLADHFGASKQMIIKRLRAAGVENVYGRGRTVDNYRLTNPPYGHRVQEGRLVTSTAEMKVIRLIAELRERRGLAYSKVADELNRQGLKTRMKKVWNTALVTHVHKKWKGKL